MYFLIHRGRRPNSIFQKSVLQMESNYEKIRHHLKNVNEGVTVGA